MKAYEWAIELDSDLKDLLMGDVAEALIAAVTIGEELAEHW